MNSMEPRPCEQVAVDAPGRQQHGDGGYEYCTSAQTAEMVQARWKLRLGCKSDQSVVASNLCLEVRWNIHLSLP